MITIKSDEEVRIMREAGRIAGEVLQMLAEAVKPGVTEKDLDKIVRKEYAKRGVTPTFLGYHGYPATVCVSVNEKLVHGIPSDRAFKKGDIVSIDLGATYNSSATRR
jgi:methionyl aminopeptidase